jgi:hypothetical protein
VLTLTACTHMVSLCGCAASSCAENANKHLRRFVGAKHVLGGHRKGVLRLKSLEPNALARGSKCTGADVRTNRDTGPRQ